MRTKLTRRRIVMLVVLASLVVIGGVVGAGALLVGLFLRAPAAEVEGQMWNAGEASEHLARLGVVGRVPVHGPDRTLAEVVWEGREGTVEIRHHASETDARAEADRTGGYAWGRLSFAAVAGDGQCLEGVRAVLR